MNFYSNDVILLGMETFKSQKGNELKRIKLVDTNSSKPFTLVGSTNINELELGSKVTIKIKVSPRQTGYSVFVEEIIPA